MATSVVFPRVQFFTNAGKPLIGGRIHTYVAGSSTRAPTYKDAARAQPNTNPIILDGRGEAVIYLDEGIEYKFVVQDILGSLIYTQEPIYGSVKQSDIRFALFVVGSEAEIYANADSFPDGARIEISSTGRRYKKEGGSIYPDDDKSAVRYVSQDASIEQQAEARHNIDSEKRFRHPSMTDVSHSGGNNSLLLEGQVNPNDLRGALYEKGVPNAVWFSDDLRLNIDGEIYVNRQGWQRCRGKRYGRIVVYGSSTPAGFGTSDYFAPSAENGWTESPNSWVGLMRSSLGNEAEVVNRSSPGEQTTRGIDMFWRNVAPYSPDTVILAFGFVNEGSGEVVRRTSDVLARYLRLCSMCSRIGAKPIVVVTMAGNTQDLLHTYSIASAMREHGIAVWDISCAVKDINSDAIAADYQYDTTHANNAGHLRYFQNINISDIDLDLRSAGKSQIQSMLGKNLAYEVVPAAGNAPLEAVFTGSRPLDFCAYTRVKRKNSSVSINVCPLNIQGFSSTEHPLLSVRSATGNWGLYVDSVLVLRSEVAISTDAEAELCLSYDRGRNRIDFYVNGVFVGSHTPSKSPTNTEGWAWFRFGQTNTGDFRADGWVIIDAVVTRNPSMNGNGIKSGLYLSNSLPLPSTMGARFGISGASPVFRSARNVESDLYSRLSVNGVKVIKV